MSKVVVVKFADRSQTWRFRLHEYVSLLDPGLKLLAGTNSSAKALSLLIPMGKVGIKTNCLTGKLNATSNLLVEVMCELLEDAKFEQNDIIIWERSSSELVRAGFQINASSFGRRCFGTDTNDIGYSSEFYSSGKANSLVSKIMTDLIDWNINLPVLKDHSIAGLSGAMKNMFGAINNPNKYHGNNCDPYTADVSNLKPIRAKNKLIVMDASKVQYQAGPGYNAQYIHNYNGMLMSTDPVAIDRIGLEIVEHCRKLNKLPRNWVWGCLNCLRSM